MVSCFLFFAPYVHLPAAFGVVHGFTGTVQSLDWVFFLGWIVVKKTRT
jgi:hypothetical protein